MEEQGEPTQSGEETEPSVTERLTRWISIGAILLATTYLVLIALGRVPVENRLGQMEVILFIALLILNPSVVSRLASLNISSKGLSVQLNKVARKQALQQLDIDQLKFLITHYLSDDELRHLTKLDGTEPFVYEVQGHFVDELRHLRSLRLIESLPGKGLARLPGRGDLRHELSITKDGKRFLTWWRAELELAASRGR
jgi:hypothetical protein